MVIYKITNLLNNKIYIGKDTTNNDDYFGSGVLIKRAIDKYGINNFEKVILETCDSNGELCDKEKFWINLLKSTDLTIGYNISNGGDGGDTISNNPNKENILKKISESMKNRVFTEIHKEKLSKNHYSTKYRKGKTYNDMYGEDSALEYKQKLKESRNKYTTEKDRLGDKYDEYILKMRKRFIGDNNPMKKHKYYWYFNVKTGEQTRIIENGLIPDGFVKGRKQK